MERMLQYLDPETGRINYFLYYNSREFKQRWRLPPECVEHLAFQYLDAGYCSTSGEADPWTLGYDERVSQYQKWIVIRNQVLY